MRTNKEMKQLEVTSAASIGCRKTYTNPKKEYFVYERGKLVAYTDQRVIAHEDDTLVNLASTPFVDNE